MPEAETEWDGQECSLELCGPDCCDAAFEEMSSLYGTANIMREFALRSAPGPWFAVPDYNFSADKRHVIAAGGVALFEAHGEYEIAGYSSLHAAQWSPPVALVVADWLESEADAYWERRAAGVKEQTAGFGHAVAVVETWFKSPEALYGAARPVPSHVGEKP